MERRDDGWSIEGQVDAGAGLLEALDPDDWPDETYGVVEHDLGGRDDREACRGAACHAGAAEGGVGA